MLSNGELHKEYASQLTKRQLDIYRDIKMDRFRIWVKATIASFVFAVFLSRFLEDKDAHMRTCFMVFVFFLIQYLIYTIHPKKQYMLQYIENQKGNYKETLRESNHAIDLLGWNPQDRLKTYISNLKND